MLLIYFISVVCGARAAIFYDSYSGTPITAERVKQHDKANTTFWCVNEIEPCDPKEGRRVDGSCNNLKFPSRGATHTPFARVLPPVFSANFEPKKAADGSDLPLARYLRTSLVPVGRIPSQMFTALAVHDFVFMSADIVSLHDTVNYIVWKPYCCTERGRTDYACTPNPVPADDPVHRFSGIRCLNMTRPETFQSIGCIKNGTTPERIVSSTPLLDLSVIYGNGLQNLLQRGRLFRGGLLKFEVEDGRVWPPKYQTTAHICFANQRPQETRCHLMPEDGGNTLGGINLMTIWFWRHHNFIARHLAALNPCWTDDKLFEIARDINIAVSLQIYYYELLPIFFGYDNMVKDGVITPTGGFRDPYNPDVMPQVSLEYPFVLRWVHTIQNGPLKMYDKDGYYMKQIPIVNLTLRTGYIGLDDNLDLMTQGSFRQGSDNVDHTADFDITEVGLGPHQYVSDLMTSDLAKNRLFGFQPYVKYREFCFGNKVKSFDDLHGSIDPERIEMLKDVYKSVEDIDLLAAIWLEKPLNGGFAPPTFYCLVIEQLRRNMVSDRHWYERPNRPNAYTAAQLAEIRKATIARLLCDVGDTVTRIQPRAFLKAGYHNRMCNCEQITGIDYSAWKDPTCEVESFWSKFV